MTDGELVTGYIDVDGHWTGGEPAMILPIQQFNVNTGTSCI